MSASSPAAGNGPVFAPVTVAPSSIVLSAQAPLDSGTLPPSSISGSVLIDQDGDGIADGPLAQVLVSLNDANDSLIEQTSTNEKGMYAFYDVPAGTYFVRETNPAGHVDVSDTSDTGNTTDNEIIVLMNDGDTRTGNNFIDRLTVVQPSVPSTSPSVAPILSAPSAAPSSADAKMGIIYGHVYVKDSGDQTAHKPLVGVVISLVPDDTSIQTVRVGTNVAGYYEFVDVLPGKYKIIQSNLEGYTNINDTEGDPTDGTISVEISNAALSSGNNDFVDAASTSVEGTNTNNDNVPDSATLYISGRVWADTDGDGVGDAVLSGVQIDLRDLDGHTILTEQTDDHGLFEFSNVAPAKYQIVETNLPGYTEVSDSQGEELDNLILVDLTNGTSSYDNSFTDAPPPNVVIATEAPGVALYVSGRVQADTNGDSLADEALPGVMLELINLGTNETLYKSTDDKGLFEFDEVNPGKYKLLEINLPGYTDIWDSEGDAHDSFVTLDLTEGMSSYDNNFVDAPPANLIPTDPPTLAPAIVTGEVLADTDGDGEGDTPLSGVEVLLIDDGDNVVFVDFTDSQGIFNFTEAIPTGKYHLTQTNLANYVDLKDSEGDPYDSTVYIDFHEGTPSGNHQFVDRPVASVPSAAPSNDPTAALPDVPGSISGRVFVDTDGDGIGDVPLPGVSVDLYSENNKLETSGTDQEGIFTFFDVPAGTYQIVENKFQGYIDASNTNGNKRNSTISVTLKNGEASVDIMFVDKPENDGSPLGIISGTVFADSNGDGIGDLPLESVRVDLLDRNGGSLAMVGTSKEGVFVFHDIPAGSYQLTHSTLPGYEVLSDSDGATDNLIRIYLLDGKSSLNNAFVDAAPPGLIVPTIAPSTKTAAPVDSPSAAAPSDVPFPVPGTVDPPSVKAVENSLANPYAADTVSQDGLSSGAVAGIVIFSIFCVVLVHLFIKRRRSIRGSSSSSVSSLAPFSKNFASRGSLS